MKHPGRASATAPSTDPQLLRMLTTHTHCGEAMTTSHPEPMSEGRTGTTQDVVTYSCACGFRFDQPTDSLHHDKELP